LLSDFNLVISTSRGNEKNTCSEMWYLLGEVGDRGSNIQTTAAIGLVVATTKLDGIKAIRDLRGLLKDRPWEFKYTLKLVPIQKVVDANLEAIQAAALELAKGIREKEVFRITIEKRHTELKSKTIIDTVAKKIERTVNLEHPDRILMIEIIGERAGLALIAPDDVLSVEREKRKS
jgi:tRNA acetyltransferase TAN1